LCAQKPKCSWADEPDFPLANGLRTSCERATHYFPGGTKDQNDKAIAAVHPSRDGLPAGQIFHAGGPSAGGWTIMAVHGSKESWERFREQILIPRLQKGIEGGLSRPPQETEIEVFNLQR
jgi:hypothetical protein